MVAKTPMKPVQRKLTPFEVKEHLGVDLFAPHSALKPGEMRACVNLDLFKNGYMKGRLGSAVLNAISETLDGYDVVAGVAWDVGAAEYAILQGIQGTSTYFITLKLERDAAFAVVNNYAGAAYSIAGQTLPMHMSVSGERVFAFGREGNAVIDWTGSAFKARPMGLRAPAFDEGTESVTDAAPGFGTAGKWTLGIELVYRVNGADFLSSGVNRLQNEGTMATFSSDNLDYIQITVDSTTIEYPAGIATNSLTDGICVRLWRSKNQAPVSDDVLDVKDTFGLEDELYPFYLGTLSQLISGDGSRFVGSYQVYFDSWADEILSFWFSSTYTNYPRTDIQVATLDYLDLSRLPDSSTGCQHKGRIWVADCPDEINSAGKVFYGGLVDSPYSETFKPQNFVPCDIGDGQKIVLLGNLGKDLLVFKEGKTGRIVNGDPELGWDERDKVIGLSHIKLASYIPALGYVAITGDQKDVRLFGYDLVWTEISGNADIAKRIRSVTKAMAEDPTYASFAWINGKLGLSPGDGSVWMLHAEEKLGWTQYVYPMAGACQFLLAFANGSRLAAFNAGRFAIEIETATDAYGEPIDTDVNDLGEEVDIESEWTRHRFQSGEGRHMLEFEKYSLVGELSHPVYAMVYSNGRYWPSNLDSEESPFTPDPSQLHGYPELMEREYVLNLKSPRPAGNFLHIANRTKGPCSIRSEVLSAFVQTEVRQDFDPFQVFRYKRVAPPWSTTALCVLTFDDDQADALDYSGWARHHTFEPGEGGAWSLLPGFAPGNGARFLPGSGSGLFSTWQAMEGMGDEDDGLNSRARSWKVVFRMPEAAAATLAQAGKPLDDANYWRLRVTAAGALVFEHGVAAAAYTFTTADGLVTPATKTYALSFVLTNGGANGQFYLTAMDASVFSGPIRTTRAALTREAPPDKHCVAYGGGIDLTWYEAMLGDMSEKDAKRFWQQMREAD